MVRLPTYRQIRLLCLPVGRLAWVQFIRLLQQVVRIEKPASRLLGMLLTGSDVAYSNYYG